MLTIEKTVLPSPEQWEIIIEGMRNPKNSWDRIDSNFESYDTSYCDHKCSICPEFGQKCDCGIGDNDHTLMITLAKGGPVHAKYRRMIPVYVTINAPLYWWKEFDTYKVGTVANSCSTMHKIHDKKFEFSDFSHEHLTDGAKYILKLTIDEMNLWRCRFLSWDDIDQKNKDQNDWRDKKDFWWQMIQLLPSSYNQTRTVMLNYEVLVGIYKWRRNHKLDEWHTFCDWIESLPYSEIIIGDDNDGTKSE